MFGQGCGSPGATTRPPDFSPCSIGREGCGEMHMTLYGSGFRSFRDRNLYVASLAAFTLAVPLALHTFAQGANESQSLSSLPATAVVKVPSTPLPVLSHEELGDLQMARKHYQGALQEYQQVWPKSAQVWNRIGIADQQLFLTEDARKSYVNALKIDPKNPDVMNNLGSIYYSLKQYRAAEHMYRKALKIKPDSPLIYKNLGTNFLAENKFQKGWDCYQAALSLDPEVFERASQLRIGEPTPALKRGAMNFYLAKSYAKAGMSDRAVEYLRMAIDEGFADRKKIMGDKEFASLYNLSSFQQLLTEQRMQ